VSAIDSIQLRVRDAVSDGGGAAKREAVYSITDELFYLVEVQQDGKRDTYADASTETVEFEVFGDSSHDVELT